MRNSIKNELGTPNEKYPAARDKTVGAATAPARQPSAPPRCQHRPVRTCFPYAPTHERTRLGQPRCLPAEFPNEADASLSARRDPTFPPKKNRGTRKTRKNITSKPSASATTDRTTPQYSYLSGGISLASTTSEALGYVQPLPRCGAQHDDSLFGGASRILLSSPEIFSGAPRRCLVPRFWKKGRR